MRSTSLPPAETYRSTDRGTRSRIDISGLLPWGELALAALLLIAFNAFG